MHLTLNTEEDLINYFNFLHQHDKLGSKFPQLVLEEGEARGFLHYLMAEDHNDEQFDTRSFDDEWKGRKRWSEEEEQQLQILIDKGAHPVDIAQAMKRTHEGVRKKARTNFNVTYLDGGWVDVPF
ncbi:MAG: hypothetical protein FNT15_05535 [Sulfurovum sp.]|nr:MAG: hypothetical protein FNT15_05535 [Sulfurovum sp.]